MEISSPGYSVVGLVFLLASLMCQSVLGSTVAINESVTAIPTQRFTDLYTEETGLAKAETIASYLQIRTGWNAQSVLETYGVVRLGADTRTFLDNSDAIYNDNYAFLGVGLDYLGLLPGVRLSTQVGASVDLVSKIQKTGLDTRTGFMTYHEWRPKDSLFNMEFYSDGFYIRRYENILATSQIRFFYDLIKIPVSQSALSHRETSIEIAPTVNIATAIDSAGLDYNRFAEARIGVRFRTQGTLAVMLNPYYAYGLRWQRPTDFPTYQDLRVLLAVYAVF